MTHGTAYADDFAGLNNGTFYEQILDDFYNEIQPYAAYVPYMMSPGNHVRTCPALLRSLQLINAD